MKRLMFIAALLLTCLCTSQADARGVRGLARFWGIHMGPGIHAKNGCRNCGDYHYFYQAPPHSYFEFDSLPSK